MDTSTGAQVAAPAAVVSAIAQGELGVRDVELALGFALLEALGLPADAWQRTTRWRRERTLSRLGVSPAAVDAAAAAFSTRS